MPSQIKIIPLCIGCNEKHFPDTPCANGTKWWTGLVECDVCTYRYVAVVPIPPDYPCSPQDIQCPKCNAFSCNEVEAN